MADTKVLSFRVPKSMAGAVERAAELQGTTPCEFMRRAILRVTSSTLLKHASEEVASRPPREGRHQYHALSAIVSQEHRPLR